MVIRNTFLWEHESGWLILKVRLNFVPRVWLLSKVRSGLSLLGRRGANAYAPGMRGGAGASPAWRDVSGPQMLRVPTRVDFDCHWLVPEVLVEGNPGRPITRGGLSANTNSQLSLDFYAVA